jgi:flavin reductase (DIM6/NTAB) family NADH-FMN oxidoreductase RutF
MEIQISSLSTSERYKLLVGLVFPRPIALVSTRSENGVANCAPYSFFNAICEQPMLVILSFARRSDGKPKHTLANLLRTSEFVVNLVDETLANGMHLSSKEVDENVSEFTEAGFKEAPCRMVAHPRIAEAPVSFECRLFRQVEVGPERETHYRRNRSHPRARGTDPLAHQAHCRRTLSPFRLALCQPLPHHASALPTTRPAARRMN